jgi:hypothetical protein
MNLYAVRTVGLVPVGLFFADDTKQLAIMVDVQQEPLHCEYRIIDEPTCIVFEHPNHEVSWGLGIRADDHPGDTTDDEFDEWAEWFQCRLNAIRNSISFDNDAIPFPSQKGVTLSDVMDGKKNVHGWRKFSDNDQKAVDKAWYPALAEGRAERRKKAKKGSGGNVISLDREPG